MADPTGRHDRYRYQRDKAHARTCEQCRAANTEWQRRYRAKNPVVLPRWTDEQRAIALNPALSLDQAAELTGRTRLAVYTVRHRAAKAVTR